MNLYLFPVINSYACLMLSLHNSKNEGFLIHFTTILQVEQDWGNSLRNRVDESRSSGIYYLLTVAIVYSPLVLILNGNFRVHFQLLGLTTSNRRLSPVPLTIASHFVCVHSVVKTRFRRLSQTGIISSVLRFGFEWPRSNFPDLQILRYQRTAINSIKTNSDSSVAREFD